MADKENVTQEDFSTEEAVKEAMENAEVMEEAAEDASKENAVEDASEASADAKASEEQSSEDEDSEDEASEDESSEEKGFFKKKNKKDKKDEQIEQLTDQLKRSMAEFQNFRNRTDKEKTMMFDMGSRTMVEKILPVVDNFERGLSGVNEGDDAFSDGILMIYRQLMTVLADAGVTPIEAAGQEFNPDLHNAVMQVPAAEGQESGTVAAELQKGYMYKDTVVRHSMVSVVE